MSSTTLLLTCAGRPLFSYGHFGSSLTVDQPAVFGTGYCTGGSKCQPNQRTHRTTQESGETPCRNQIEINRADP